MCQRDKDTILKLASCKMAGLTSFEFAMDVLIGLTKVSNKTRSLFKYDRSVTITS
jgi:hypothetical protein